MTRDQLMVILAIVGILGTVAQQFYALKTEVDTMRIEMRYLHGEFTVPR